MTPEYRQQKQYIQTGDVLLFSGKGAFSNIIKRFTRSKWSHVGVAVRATIGGSSTIFLLESTTLSNVRDIRSGEYLRGVQLVRLSERMAAYEGSCAFRHVYADADMDIVNRFIEQYHGTPYEEDKRELILSALDGPFNLGANVQDLSSLFCSELVAQLWRELGWLETEQPSNEFDPRNFANEGRDAVDDIMSHTISEIRYLKVA